MHMAALAPSRERLLNTATELFYSGGITATGVDKVAALAGVSKPTLYAQFRSKDDLITAVLERRHDQQVASLDSWLQEYAKGPRARLLAVFDWLGEWYATQGSRGCAFLNAAAEVVDPDHPARDAIRRHKQWMRDYLAILVEQAGLPDPKRLGADLMLLVDGASARMLVDGDPRTAKDVRRVAALLVGAIEKLP